MDRRTQLKHTCGQIRSPKVTIAPVPSRPVLRTRLIEKKKSRANQTTGHRLRNVTLAMDIEPDELGDANGGGTDMDTPQDPVFYAGLYAPSGFDMMNVLLRVVNRPNPQIDLGAIDASCAIIVCDLLAEDVPIVYCSAAFEFLTGYESSEVLGRNCRFLQSPHGLLASHQSQTSAHDHSHMKNGQSDYRDTGSGSDRVLSGKTNEDETELSRLRSLLARKEEAQVVITNFKKGGQPFRNLLTTVPVHWDYDSHQLRYAVGFQADRSTLF